MYPSNFLQISSAVVDPYHLGYYFGISMAVISAAVIAFVCYELYRDVKSQGRKKKKYEYVLDFFIEIKPILYFTGLLSMVWILAFIRDLIMQLRGNWLYYTIGCFMMLLTLGILLTMQTDYYKKNKY